MSCSKNKYFPFFMWFLPLVFFAYQFILRLWPGLMMHQIIDQFSIDASHFGMLAACYYYGYSGMQIPVAFLLDKFGARKIIFLFAVLCGFSTLMFTYTDNFYLALVSRFLIGAGSAVGFLGVSKVISEWFPKEQYAKMVGYSFTFGLMGAIYGGKPISLMIEKHYWQNVAITLGVISIVIGVTTYLLLRSPRSKQETVEIPLQLSSFKSILSSKVVWFLAISNLLMVGSLEGFADVWGVPYLVVTYGFDKSDAAGLVSFIFLGMLIGGPLLAWFSQKIGHYLMIALCGLGMISAFLLLLFYGVSSATMLGCLFFIIGVMCCYQVLVFAAGSELVPINSLGMCVAFLNSINMLGGSFFHTLIGRAMDFFWDGRVSENGARIYSVEAYQYALSLIPVCALVGVGIIVFIGFKSKKYRLCRA